jgi:hypothetical protein
MGSSTLALSVYMPASVQDVSLGQLADSMIGVPVPAFAGSFRATARPRWGAAAPVAAEALDGPAASAKVHAAAASVAAMVRWRRRRTIHRGQLSLRWLSDVIRPPQARASTYGRKLRDIKPEMVRNAL